MDYTGVNVNDLLAKIEADELVVGSSPYKSHSTVQEVEVADEVRVVPNTVPDISTSTNVPSSSRSTSIFVKERKAKHVEDKAFLVWALDPETLEMSDIYVRNVKVVDTLVTYFNEGIFGRPKLQLDIYHHFGSEVERACVRGACKEEGLTHGEMALNSLLEATTLIKEGEVVNHAYHERTHDTHALFV